MEHAARTVEKQPAGPQPVKLAIESVDFFMRNMIMRMPFRYGNACLTASPLLHVRLRARGTDGEHVEGVSADILPPKWFDKSTGKNYRQNIDELVRTARIGAKAWLDAASLPKAPFAIWREAHTAATSAAKQGGLNALTGSFGSSLIERAMLDAAGKLMNADFHAMARENHLGVNPETIHPELDGRSLGNAVMKQPLSRIHVRHTVGLGDPIYKEDVPASERLEDGLPQSLAECVKMHQLRYFKVKVHGRLDKDLERLGRIATLLEVAAPADYKISLDGNEQFKEPQQLADWLTAVSGQTVLREFMKHVIYIEQPMDRNVALTAAGASTFADFPNLPPVIIDESDDDLHSFKRAAALGYRGVSVKNCKGVFKGLLNLMLTQLYNEEGDTRYLLTGEDLCNQPLVPLQQDLCTLSVLGVDHAERNGHHYGGTLGHLSLEELNQCLEVHAALYEQFQRSARLSIHNGQLDLSSLPQPGFGVGMITDFRSMTPLDDWEYDSLGLDDNI